MPYEIDGAKRHLVEEHGISLSVYEAGEPSSRPTVVLSHGFPDIAFTWRDQLWALAEAGYHALAPDQRGCGGSSRPEAVEDYDIFALTGDLKGMLDRFEIDRAVLVGHDWGGLVVWQMALLHPVRVAGVVGVNTPYFPRLPMPPTEIFAMADPNHYIVKFQEREGPDARFAENVDRIFTHLMRKGVSPDDLAEARVDQANDFVDSVLNAPLLGEAILTDNELAVYTETFRESGFTGGLNWYRNFDRNWELTPQLDGAHIEVPSLMVTAEWDPVLTPAMAEIMVPFVPDLETHLIEKCGHWTQQEHPDELNRLLIDWLQRRFPG